MAQRPLTGTQVLELNDHWQDVLAIARRLWGDRPGDPDPATLRAAGLAFLTRATEDAEAAE